MYRGRRFVAKLLCACEGLFSDGEIISGFGSRRPPPQPGTLTLPLTRGLLGWCASWSLCFEKRQIFGHI